jgi:uncharacterized protein (DUF2062 family)/SAM-dependent methyltransferase
MRLARRLFTDLRLEGAGRTREAVAMGLGAFIGCTPLYGFHLLLVMIVGRLFRLNRLKMYVAANISNPFFAPALILAEVQCGAWLRRGDLHALTLDTVRNTDPWVFGADLVIGSIVIGVIAGALVALATFSAVGAAPVVPAHIERVFAAAADRYLDQSITAWEFARGKLRHDPVYRATLAELDATTGTLVDVGCGQGLTLAVLVEARAHAQRGDWPADAPRPAFDHLVGIDTRQRVTRLASRALGDAAHIIHAAAPDGLPESFGAALLFDVLHLMPEAEQRRIVRGIWTRLPAGGVLLVREVDAAAGGGFRAVRIGNRIKALAVGRWRQTFHFRTASAWHAVFASVGFEVETRSMGEGTPFANVLFRLSKRESARE